VHLDHAGGAGQMMRRCRTRRAVLHPRGAPHLVDPAKLIAGTIAVYGEATYRALYGELLPIPADRVLLADDGLRLRLGQRTFEFIDAPGHARHHHCPIDLDFRDVYAGDNFGICYREFDTAAGPFMLPTTTPVHFEPDAAAPRPSTGCWRTGRGGSCRRTSARSRTSRGSRATCMRSLDALVGMAQAPRRRTRTAGPHPRRDVRLLQRTGSTRTATEGDLARRHEFIDEDVNLNTQGLEVWLSRH
jgi:hypothetical protein